MTLKDVQGNGATGQEALLTAVTVTVANSTAKVGSRIDNDDGTYIASTVNNNLTAALKLMRWTAAESSA